MAAKINVTSNSTYYIKKGSRYLPVGIAGPDLYEGIWLVQVTQGCRSSKNLYIRLADLPDCHDLEILAKVTMLEEIITNTMSKAWANGASASISEVAQKIASALATAEMKLTQKQMRR